MVNFRFIDHVIGAPILWCLGTVRRKRYLPNTIQRIGLLRTRAIGDAILSSALIQAIKYNWPECRIIYFADESTNAIAPLIPGIDEIIEISAIRFWRSIIPMRAAKLDLLFDLGAWPRIDAILAAIAGARFTIGFATAGQSRHYAFDQTVEHRPDIHEVNNYLRLLSETGFTIPNPPPVPALQPTNSFETTRDRLAALDFDKPYCILHPWAGGSNPALREWPEDRWVELAVRLHGTGHTIVISGGPADQARAANMAAHICAAIGQRNVICASGIARLSDMFWLLQSAALVISVNTSTMHLAAAVGARLIGLHGPTNPARWGPISTNSVVVRPQGHECGFLNLGFEYLGNPTDCMGRLSIDYVWMACKLQPIDLT